jgi:hypothetical protein
VCNYKKSIDLLKKLQLSHSDVYICMHSKHLQIVHTTSLFVTTYEKVEIVTNVKTFILHINSSFLYDSLKIVGTLDSCPRARQVGNVSSKE